MQPQEKATDEDKVHIGKDGYLFLSGGRHAVFALFSGDQTPNEISVQNFCANLESRADWANRTQRAFRMVVFPEKCVAMRNWVDHEDPLDSVYKRVYSRAVAASACADRLIYSLPALEGREDCFSKTDTHYSAIGCLALAEQLLNDYFPDDMKRITEKIREMISEKPGFSGDLGRKLASPPTETRTVFNKQIISSTMASNGMQGGNDGICVLAASTNSVSDKTLLIFGDSFFRQLMPILPAFYRRVIFCRTRYFHYELAEAFQPDHVFCGIAERYLSRCSLDADRPHFLSYPLLLGRPLDPDPKFAELWGSFINQKALISGAE